MNDWISRLSYQAPTKCVRNRHGLSLLSESHDVSRTEKKLFRNREIGIMDGR